MSTMMFHYPTIQSNSLKFVATRCREQHKQLKKLGIITFKGNIYARTVRSHKQKPYKSM